MVLLYHNIANKNAVNAVSVTDFELQLKYISEFFKPVTVKQYVAELGNNPLPKKAVAVTFDDAYTCIQHLVLPILKKYNVHATVFVPTNHVGKYNVWEGGNNKTEIMDWDTITALDKSPFLSFESHGYNHVSFGHIDDVTRQEEFSNSKRDLEKHLKRPIEYFAYPFGQLEHRGKNDASFLTRNGYKAAFTTNFGKRNTARNIFKLNRIDVTPQMDFETFKAILNKKFSRSYYKQLAKNFLFKMKPNK